MPAARRVLVAVVVAAGLLLGAAPAGAARHPLAPLRSDPTARPLAGPVRDRVLKRRAQARAAAALPGVERTYTTADGYRVRVSVSPLYVFSDAAALTYVNYLDSLLHGSELGSLALRIETPLEVAQDCGASEALACYDPAAGRMYVPGEETPVGQPPLVFVVAHEYAHHVAAHRSNYPWSAGRWGPKRWASNEQVCFFTAAHQLFPGDEGSHYRQNPGEAWAEAYAMRLYPESLPAWGYSQLLRPDAAAFEAIRRDVVSPWPGQHHRARTLQVRRGRLGVRRIRLATPLDGASALSVRPSRGLRVELRAYVNGRLVRRTRKRRISTLVCGARRLEYRVVRRAGRGTVRVSVSWP